MHRLLSLLFLLLICGAVLSAQEKSWEKELLRIDATIRQQERVDEIGVLLDFVTKYSSDSSAKGAAYRRLGITYQEKGDLERSLFYQLRALNLADKSEDAMSRASSLNNIASLYYALGDLVQSQRYFLEAYRLFGNLADEKRYARKGQSDLALNLATINLENGKLAEAKHFLDLAYQHLVEFGDTSEVAYLYLLEGNIAEAENRFSDWFRSLEQLERYLRIYEDPSIRLMGHQQWATYYEQIGQEDSIPTKLKQALELAYSLENPSSIRQSAKDLSRYFDRRGDSLQAYQYLKIYQVFNDSLLDAARIKAMIDAEQKFQNEAKTLSIQTKEEELQKKRFQLILIGGLCLLLLALSVLVVKNRNKTKRLAEKDAALKEGRIKELMQEQELKSIDAMLKGQDDERQRIARDLHDRLGSILSTVKLHFSTMEDEIRKLQEKQNNSYELATKMLDEAVDEVRKISHDLHSGAISKFGLKRAVDELIKALRAKNGLDIYFMDNQIEADTLAPFEVELYRIIQELLSNTLKHAQASEVHIQLTQSEGFVSFSYEDNGVGMDKSKLNDKIGLGLISIENRVQKMNGRSTLDSTPGHGFTFIIEIPL